MVKQAVFLGAVVVVTVLARGVDGQVSTELVPGESAGGVRAKPVSDIQALHEITSLADAVVACPAKKAGDPGSIAALKAGSQAARFRQGGPCVFFSDQADFESFAEAAGAVLTGLETFEESILMPAGVSKVDDPLSPGVPNQPDTEFPFPNGLEDVDNMVCQTNRDAGNPDEPNPDGVNGLAAVAVGFGGATSDVVVSNTLGDSTDMIFTADNVTGVGFNTVTVIGGNTVEIRIYDLDNILVATGTAPVDPGGSNFFGVWCEAAIERVNVWDPDGGAEGADNIQIWALEDPCGECPMDADGNSQMEAFDLAYLLGMWGPCAPDDWCQCFDSDSDGVIGAADLAVLLGSWGPCP